MKRAFPTVLVWLGIPAIAAVWLLASRLSVGDKTVWTWESGAQMVGFSLMHSGLGALLVLAVTASLLWPVLVLVVAAIRRNIGGKTMVAMLVVNGARLGAAFYALRVLATSLHQQVHTDSSDRANDLRRRHRRFENSSRLPRRRRSHEPRGEMALRCTPPRFRRSSRSCNT